MFVHLTALDLWIWFEIDFPTVSIWIRFSFQTDSSRSINTKWKKKKIIFITGLSDFGLLVIRMSGKAIENINSIGRWIKVTFEKFIFNHKPRK